MPLGDVSLGRLRTCRTELQRLILSVDEGIEQGDLAHYGIGEITVLCGWRGEAAQNQAVADKASKTPWPRSKHNVLDDNGEPCSDAVDVAPYPVEWNEPGYARKLEMLHCYVAGVAHQMGIDLRGISWDRPHIEFQGFSK
jgi:peptidoglycan L-alanyl-D-glutamate endopeptidase CwlK